MIKREHSMKILKVAVDRIECNFQDGEFVFVSCHSIEKAWWWKGGMDMGKEKWAHLAFGRWIRHGFQIDKWNGMGVKGSGWEMEENIR